jgi:hypothetical protein
MSREHLIICLAVILLAAGSVYALDTDGDGLADNVESQIGSNPRHKDIFVEVDWLVANGKSMKPRGNFVQIAQAIFADAPVPNPDGTTGINLHVQLSQGIRVSSGIAFFDLTPGAANWAQFDALKQQFFTPSRRYTHHYCLFVDAIIYEGTTISISGISRNNLSNFGTGASDFIVALGPSSGFFNYPTPGEYKWTQVGTFIHELGHNLALRHGGRDHVSFKPNHLSLMSYAFQALGVPVTANNGSRY